MFVILGICPDGKISSYCHLVVKVLFLYNLKFSNLVSKTNHEVIGSLPTYRIWEKNSATVNLRMYRQHSKMMIIQCLLGWSEFWHSLYFLLHCPQITAIFRRSLNPEKRQRKLMTLKYQRNARVHVRGEARNMCWIKDTDRLRLDFLVRCS